ncbi:hypothetical protein B0H11DRAFT_2295013 [Mycena galericulata]|nr:hypothetical protein B0H11DRAFT_2295013 [Mycena galericulata]
MDIVFREKILDVAARALDAKSPVDSEKMRDRLEWAWGLEHGTLDEHLANFSDPYLVDILMDDSLILLPHSDQAEDLFSAAADTPFSFSKPRITMQELYKGRQTFEYIVLPVDPSSDVPPRVLLSPVPPHLTISSSVDKIFRRWGHTRDRFNVVRNAWVECIKNNYPAGATSTPSIYIFVNIRYVHESWAITHVPLRFLGLDGSEDEESDGDSYGTMYMEVETLADEPQRRLLPHELEQEPVLKLPILRPVDDEDDVISCDSLITGVEDPEEFAKASLARGDYEPSRTWLKGMERWVRGASETVDGEMLLNDGQIEEDFTEKPRVATSLDLNQPDYLESRPHKIRRAAR